MEVRKIEKSLKKKGFVRNNKDHKRWIFFTKDGLKTAIHTSTSHGHKEISKELQSVMARETKLSNDQFRNLINCSISYSDYQAILEEKGEI